MNEGTVGRRLIDWSLSVWKR